MNYHGHRYTNIPEWSRYYSYSEYKVGGGWNYARYGGHKTSILEVINP